VENVNPDATFKPATRCAEFAALLGATPLDGVVHYWAAA